VNFRSLFIKETGSRLPRNDAKAEARISRMPTQELNTWANNTIYAVGRNLSEYAKDPSCLPFLDEAVEGSRVLAKLVLEMRQRIT
jgi:hypothetical protein